MLRRILQLVLVVLTTLSGTVCAQVIGVQPTPIGLYAWDTASNTWNQVPNSSTAEPYTLTPQPFALYGWNSSLGQWTPCTTAAACGLGSASFTPDAIQYATSQSATRAATGNDLNSLIQDLSGCTTVNTFYSPQAGACLAAGGSTGGPYNDANYTTDSSTSYVGPLSNTYTLPLDLSTSQINTVLGTQNIAVKIQAGDAHTPFTNGTGSHSDKVVDERVDVPVSGRSLKEWGAQCDLRTINGTLSGTTLTASGLSSADIGKTLVAVGTYNGIPTAYEGQIVSGSGTTWTVTANPGLTISTSETMGLGTDDTAAITAALAAQLNNSFQNNVVLTVPVGNCLTHVQTKNPQALRGFSPYLSRITSYPGESIFSVGGGLNQVYSSFALNVDDEIDATQPWQYIDASGNLHSVAAVYQPIMQRTGFANNPLGPGWFTGPGANGGGAINGVAAVTNGSPTITVASAAIPEAGQQIVFPYISPIFSTTVSTVSGSTVTLAANYPGTTTAQAEWFAGTSAQSITSLSTAQCTLPCVIPATGRTFPMAVNVANSIAPTPAGESNVAGFGVVKIDGEEFSYAGLVRSTSGTNSITLLAGQQNGTEATEHDANAVIFPLNPFEYDSMPWPVTPTINSGGTTPAGAEYYPAFNVGNFGYGTPWYDGSSGGVSGPYQAEFDNLLIQPWPAQNGPGNNMAALYFVGVPYATHFQNLNLYGTYCFVEGEASINTHYYSETADGMSANNISCHSGHLGTGENIIAGGETEYSNWNTYGGGAGGGDLSGGGFNITFGYDDQTGGQNQQVNNSVFTNIYNEPGNYAYGGATGMELDCDTCIWNGWAYSGGGDVLIGGAKQTFNGGGIASTIEYPAINYGFGNSFDKINMGLFPQGNAYAVNDFLNFGANASGCVITNYNLPCVAALVGNIRRPSAGQTADTFATGNLTAPYVDPIEGFVTPEEFNTQNVLDVNPFSVGWTYDSTAPITNSYAACNLGGSAVCASDHWGGIDNGQTISIGPGQRLAAGLYLPTIAVKSTEGAGTFVFALQQAYCGNTVFYTQTVSVTSTWQTVALPPADLSAESGCSLTMRFESASITTQLQIAFVDFQPVAQNITSEGLTLADITGCLEANSSGTVYGSGTGCGAAPVTGFTALLDASQGSGDTTLSIDSVIGTIPASGGYYHLDSEWEEFTGVTNLGGGDYQLTGVTRAQFATTAAAHSSGAGVISMIQGLVAPSLTNFAWVGGTATSGYFLALDCPFGSSANDTVLFEVGCASGSDSFSVGDGGNFAENSAYPSYFFNSTLSFNDSITGSKDLLDNAYALTRSNLVAQVSLPNQFTASVGFGAGIPGGVEAVQAPTAGAPYLVNLFVPSGSTTNTYVCQGTDAFGGNIPGTSASIENLASSGWGSGNVIVYCPPIPGAVSTSLYRTAGVPNTGLLKTSSVPQLTYQDFYATATSGTPNPTNTTVPVVCAGGQQFCLLSGTSGTPPITCTASQQGWEYFDTTSADAPIQFCESDAWTVFAGGGGSGTVESGSNYALPAYGSSASTTVGPSNIVTDSTGDNLTVPGQLHLVATGAATEQEMTYNTGQAPAGVSGSAVIAPDSTGNLDVSENGGTLYRVCTSGNGQCAGGGAVAVPTGGATLVVDNTSVTASSQIQLTFDSSLGSLLGVTCNTTINQPSVSARTAGTSFTITMANSVSTNPDCVSYTIIN